MNPESYFLETKNRLCNSNCSENMLNVLKESFRNDINSTRRFDSIRSVAALIDILEKRDLLNSENPALLNRIAAILEININKPVLVELPISVLNLGPITKTELIHSLICREIGKKWKELARELGINEGEIDALEESYPTIPQRVKEILLHYDRYNSEPFGLLNALKETRRNDLRLKVQKILSK